MGRYGGGMRACSALSARVWSRPKRKDASSAGSRGVNSALSVLVKGGLASAVAGAAAAEGEGGVVMSLLGRKAPKLRTSCLGLGLGLGLGEI